MERRLTFAVIMLPVVNHAPNVLMEFKPVVKHSLDIREEHEFCFLLAFATMI